MTGTSLNGASVLLLGATGGLGRALGEELAARNAALDLAAADWHLVLDADEWLIEGGEFLRQLRHIPPEFVGQVQLLDENTDIEYTIED
jgi:NAD(P)-dependent dehydrogenase (short-subunit alcohol dehydrogenase family)